MRFALAFPLLLICMPLTACGSGAPSLAGGAGRPSSKEAPSFINGVYAYNGTINSQLLSNPAVDGVVFYIPWSTVEPSDGVFDWSSVDQEIQPVVDAGKKVALAITPGRVTPTWVFTDGAQSFTFLWDQNFAYPYCTPIKIPVPWDSVYLTKWLALIQAFGAKYDKNPNVSHIEASGISSKTMETFLPWQATEDINGVCTVGGSGGSSNTNVASYVTQWQAAGYTRTKVENAWSQMATAYNAAFPDKLWGPVIPGGVFPPIDNNGNVIPGTQQDFQAPQDILNMGVSSYPSMFVGQNNGLGCTGTTCFISPQITAISAQVVTGYQTVSPLGSNLQAAVNIMLQNKAKFIEIYVGDINNPSAQAAVQYAHQMLATQ